MSIFARLTSCSHYIQPVKMSRGHRHPARSASCSRSLFLQPLCGFQSSDVNSSRRKQLHSILSLSPRGCTSPLFASSRHSSLATRHGPFVSIGLQTLILSLRSFSHPQSFVINNFRTLFAKHPGWHPLRAFVHCIAAQKRHSASPLFATLTHSVSRKSFPCHSYENTRDGYPTTPELWSVNTAPRNASGRLGWCIVEVRMRFGNAR